MEWTSEQNDAIFKKDSNILVAAAAGSGKTAVLVERIINKIINEKVDINKILVVTFTNAAAAEMRERILEQIYVKLNENPDDENLQRQITLLGKASICTIDSFCLEVVRNNFYELENVSPNFRIADTSEIDILKQEVIEELFEEKYENKDENFLKLINTYTSYKDDTPLKDLIIKIYTYIQSNPFPEKWLNEKIKMFNLKDCLDRDFSNTIWGKVLLEQIEEILIDDISSLQSIEAKLSLNPDLDDFQKIISDDVEKILDLKNNLNSWDIAYEKFINLKFVTWSRKKVDSEIKEEAKKIRDVVKTNYTGKNAKIGKILFCNSYEANNDVFDMYKILTKLKDIILEYGDKFYKAKRDKNIVDFTDIEHFALKILLKQDENENVEKTQVAKRYESKFQEIAIDEYQDSNLLQEYILTAVASGCNTFMVGDVKQSIYKFRQAMPELFLDKYRKYKNKQEKADNEDLKIQLFKNFRSRQNVLDFTNLIFKNIMSSSLGDLEYNHEEFLNYGADYKDIEKQDLNTEINIINIEPENSDDISCEKDEDEDETDKENEQKTDEVEEVIENVELEAKFVAKKIKDLIDSKYQVFDKKTQKSRDISYKDIVILLRSTSSNAPIFENELISLDLPVFTDSSNNYLDSIEITTIISLLKIINNPMQDIPLVSVMRSPIASFTDNDLVEIRLIDKYENFYNCLLKAKKNVSKNLEEKIDRFLENIDNWRSEKQYLSLDELIWKIYLDTGYYNYVGLMPNGEVRQANLKLLFEKARQYEKASFKGLYNFINFIEKIKLSSGDMSSAKVIGENDDVIRIMSIHKSKGLEFPVVFLSTAGKQFNMRDLNNPVLMHQDMGIGVKYIDYDMQVEYDTLTKTAIREKILKDNISEEMRVLYVALTRAKEKLIITSVQRDYIKFIQKMEQEIGRYELSNGKINPILLKKHIRYIDWILMINLYNKEVFDKIAKINILNKNELIKALNIQQANENDENESVNVLDKIEQRLENIDENYRGEILNQIKEDLEYKYKHQLSTKIQSKMSVSQIKAIENKESFENEKEISFRAPEFIEDNTSKITSAKKGTLLHLCMQKLNINEDYDLNKIQSFIQKLVSQNLITKREAQAINPKKILGFVNSEIWKELKNAKEVYREKPFYINIPAKEIYQEDTDEYILVQGIIDLYYITNEDKLILLDYKTDYVQNENEQGEKELIDKYKKQLELYKRALEDSLNRNVDEVYIYSTSLDKKIKL